MAMHSDVTNTSAIRFHVSHVGQGRAFLVAAANAGQDAACALASAYQQIALVLAENGLDIVQERVFGSMSVEAEALATRSRIFSLGHIPTATPVTFIEGRPPWGEGLAGIIISAVRRTADQPETRTLWAQGRACGRLWYRDGAVQVVLQGITGGSHHETISRGLQVTRAIEQADRLLREAGLSYRDVVRTWFYIADILDWYAEFNKARSTSYQEFNLLAAETGSGAVLPASTGIGARAPGSPALCLDLVAASGPPSAPLSITRVCNPGQQEAPIYGSAFARAVVMRTADSSLLQLSGTAAIDEHGRSLFPGDTRAQIVCTLEKVALLLGQAQADLHDIVAATAFIKRAGDVQILQEVLGTLELTGLPIVCVVADVCRDELLFELDAEVQIRTRTA